MACVLCRKRKLRCDGARPACATCARLSHDCVYDEVRKKSGPKRGYVKALEARLAQVETMLKTQDPSPTTENHSNGLEDVSTNTTASSTAKKRALPGLPDMDISYVDDYASFDPGLSGLVNDAAAELGSIMTNLQGNVPDMNNANLQQNNSVPGDPSMTDPMQMMQDSWGALIGLDVEEPLPPPDMIDEMNQIYFDFVHPTGPMLHRPRYSMAMANTSPKLRPPVALQYIVWALAASVSDKYDSFQRHYYERARYYFDRDEMRGQGEGVLSVAHVQALVLITAYEFKTLMFPRAWGSCGRASRLALMLSLHRVDGSAMDVKQCLPPPKDWIEREERRRTFWSCFSTDRYASIGTGWPMTIDEADAKTDLPSNEDAYERGIPEPSISLEEASQISGVSKLSPMGATTLLACLFGRNLLHLHRPTANENEDDLSGEFWKRHRKLDNIILNVSMGLPEKLRLPTAVGNPNSIFVNMCLHTSTICLHQAAIFKAEKHRQLAKVSAESKARCITAAAEIANIMRLSSHQDMSGFNPFTCFCLYVSARVFVQYMKARPKDDQTKSSIFFMLAAMHAMKRKNPLAESFLVQLDVDLEGAGLDDIRKFSSAPPIFAATETTRGHCPVDQMMPALDSLNGDRPKMNTYGDNGIAMHSAPRTHTGPGSQMFNDGENDSVLETFGSTSRTAYRIAKNASEYRHLPAGSRFSGIVPTATNFAPDMPIRSRHESTVHSLSPDNMDFSGSGSGNSPNSTMNSSSGRVSSIASTTSPNTNPDDSQQPSRPNIKKYGILPSADFNMSMEPNVNYNDHDTFSSNNDNTTFDFSQPSTGSSAYEFSQYTQEGFDFSQQKTGMTPAGVTDLGSMTDAEFNAMMSGVTGWEGDGIDQGGEGRFYSMPGQQ